MAGALGHEVSLDAAPAEGVDDAVPGCAVSVLCQDRKMSESTDIPTVSVNDLADDERLLDVRNPDEWSEGHAPGARLSPLRDLPTSLGNVSIDERIAVICRSGGRSSQAVEFLREQGFDAVNVDGGMQAWAEAGKPMVSESGDDPHVK